MDFSEALGQEAALHKPAYTTSIMREPSTGGGKTKNMIRPTSAFTLSFSRLCELVLGRQQSADYLYCTDAKLNFDSAPYRTENYTIGFLHYGTVEVTRDLVTTAINGPAFICMGPSVLRQWKDSDADYRMEAIFFKKEFLLPISSDANFLDRFHFFEACMLYHSALTTVEVGVVQQLLRFIQFNAARPDGHKAEMLRALIYQLLFEVQPLYSIALSDGRPHLLPEDGIVKRFRLLLAQKFREASTVHYYAELLNVSAKYLSQVLKEKTGRPAHEWIDEKRTLEARLLLRDGNLRIQEIADTLNFPDQSTFGKYFKHHFGTSPLHYRKSLGLANA